jgi:hypothetical protein
MVRKTLLNLLAGVTIALGITSCATYAKRDYSPFPGQEKEIAQYNIEEIFKKRCDNYHVSEDRLYCKKVVKCGSYSENLNDNAYDRVKTCHGDVTYKLDIHPNEKVGCDGRLLKRSFLIGNLVTRYSTLNEGMVLTKFGIGSFSFENQECQDLVEAIRYLKK